jgi:hypothetical protein
MAAAVWMIIYDLDRNHSDRYLQWFDEVHIPEKLARPGYTWAAHYQIVAGEESANSRYVALFGGTDSRVFYDPTPAQIKPSQSPETRTMMGYRSNSKMLILSEEWAVDGDSGSSDMSSGISAQSISLALFNANQNDESLGAWLAQDYLVRPGQSGIIRKFLVSTGDVRHVVVHEQAVDENLRESMVDSASNDWSEQVSGYLSYPAGTPVVAQRVWPAVE